MLFLVDISGSCTTLSHRGLFAEDSSTEFLVGFSTLNNNRLGTEPMVGLCVRNRHES